MITASELLTDIDTIRTFAGELNVRTGSGEIGRASWFNGNPSFAVDGRGRLLVSDTLRYRMEAYDSNGALVRVIERPLPATRYDPDWMTEIEAAVRSTLRGDDNRPVRAEELARIMASIVPDAPPSQLPFIHRLLVAHDGSIWVERADRHPRPALRAVAHAFGYVRHAWRPDWQAPQVFDLFSPGGRYRGTVELPSAFAPMAVTADRVYGVLYDDLGVEYVVAYALDELRSTG